MSDAITIRPLAEDDAAAFKALLFRYTGQHDVVIGTTTSGRDRSELADQIGFYVNSLALRDWVDGRESFVDLLDRVRTTAAGAYEHQEYPFDRLVDELALYDRADVQRWIAAAHGAAPS